ncbi:MAG TPA: membrane protein insertase YidC [Xanthobacteraceae bacterium]|nr:membrane protein insertase YidC [Xanthobacteraceae bacterium]
MEDQKNLLLAVVLTGIVLLAWQYFFANPQLERQRQLAQPQQQTQQTQQAQPSAQPSASPQAGPGAPPQAGSSAAEVPQTREAALATSPRVRIDTPSLSGSIALIGGRIDDIALVRYRETVDPNSPPVQLFSPSGSPHPYYAEYGWTGAAGTTAKLPGPDTMWRQEGTGALSVDHPVTLVYDNGEGLQFRRTITVDDRYLFTIKDEVTNSGGASVTLYPYALISRHGTPPPGYGASHEGPIGVMGDKCLRQGSFSLYTECHEESYKTLQDKGAITFDVTNAWFGFADKYWAATLIPNTDARLRAKFSSGLIGQTRTYQADYLLDARTIAPGGTASAEGRLFAGAKEVATVNYYNEALGLNRFELLIDWGRFYFITQPMFWSIDHIYRYVGNFGVAILIITLIVKLLFLPLANKSYASMAKMKAVQPEMQAIRTRFADDKVKQQQAMMDLYRKEKINPVAGCWPMLIQVPVFFSLYKVLLVTIEMRHAPFFGWIRDLSSPDPTTVFNLFGLLPFDPTTLPMFGSFLHIGAWPLIMGVTMFLQMKLNPPPPDPAQQVVFNWMPVIFTFMMANFSAGLVIYWAWNNTLSVAQQSFIMHRHGAKIQLWDNLKALFVKKRTVER